MATHRPTSLSSHPAPPFRPHTPDPEHEARLSQHSARLHRVEEAMRQMLFGNAKVQRHASDERVHDLQQKEAEHYAQITTPPESPKEETMRKIDPSNPSRQAAEIEKLNLNGMNDEGSWGWPGLGTWHGYSAQGITKQKRSSLASGTDERALAAMREAADEAAGES